MRNILIGSRANAREMRDEDEANGALSGARNDRGGGRAHLRGDSRSGQDRDGSHCRHGRDEPGVRAGVQGHSVCRAASRRKPLARAAAGGQVGRRAQRRRIRCAVHVRARGGAAAAVAERRGGAGGAAAVPRRACRAGCARRAARARAERGLPLPQRLDQREERRRSPSGDGLDLWRRLHRRLRRPGLVRRREPRLQGSGDRDLQLPPRLARVLCPSGAGEGIRPQRLRQLRDDGRDCRAAVGEAEHQRIRR